MSRPGPEIILTTPIGDGSYEVIECPGVWVLTYQGKPISLREKYWTADGLRMKYPRTGFNNPAHCRNLAEKLNKMFKTNEFSCVDIGLQN